jgi:cation transport protein ChaC
MTWVFAYGSLMGDALLGRFVARPARLSGYHREFAHESRKRWGSPEQPCPIVGLARGGECWGIAYAVPREEEPRIARSLARREAAGERRRETQTVETPEGDVNAWVWVSTRPSIGENPATLATRIRAAHGVVGNGTEYVRTVAQALDFHGLRDPLVDDLWARLAS